MRDVGARAGVGRSCRNAGVIVVIGAGPAGLSSAAMLSRAGEAVVVLERGEVGAAWTTRYDRLHLHTVRWLSCLPGYRIPRAFGSWPSRDHVVEYLRRYADRNALDVRTGVEVHTIEPEGAEWVVRADTGTIVAERVVVATGHSNVPFVPDWPGAFAGGIVHSSEYRNPEAYRGRRVLVVGAGNSGAEIAVDLADGGAAEVLLSVRTPPSIVRRDTLGFPSQLLGIVSMHLPVPIVDRIGATMRRLSIPDLAPYGLSAPARPYTDFLRRRVIPILDVGLVDAVRTGRVRVVTALERFDENAAVLADAEQLRVDDVIAATGFRTGLEPLVGHLGVLNDRGEPLVHAADQHPHAPGLHFVGYQVTLGGTFRLVGIEAREVARTVAARTVRTAAAPTLSPG
jgi:putative flavoprotein involved in K+ transport